MSTDQHGQTENALTLLELLVVIGILSLLAALSVPAVLKVKERAQIAKSGNNLRQIYLAFQMYVSDHNDQCFWRGEDVTLDGMEWYVHGGRETGNAFTGQGGIFNNTVPRPLNHYVNDPTIFKHPSDSIRMFDGLTHFEQFGNDYCFNCTGHYQNWADGLAGLPFSSISDPSRTIVFFETHLGKPQMNIPWAGGKKGNFIMADGELVFIEMPSFSLRFPLSLAALSG